IYVYCEVVDREPPDPALVHHGFVKQEIHHSTGFHLPDEGIGPTRVRVHDLRSHPRYLEHELLVLWAGKGFEYLAFAVNQKFKSVIAFLEYSHAPPVRIPRNYILTLCGKELVAIIYIAVQKGPPCALVERP